VRYLIIQTAFSDSAILIEPLIETIKYNDKDSFIVLLIAPHTKNIFTLNPNIDHIIQYDKHGKDSGISGLLRILKIIRGFGFDILISAHCSIRTSIISMFSKAKRKIGFKESNLNFVYTDTVSKKELSHEMDKNLQLAKPLNFQIIRKIHLYYPDDSKKLIEGIFEAYSIKEDDKIIGIAPASVWPTKRWPKEYYKKVANTLTRKGYYVVLMGNHKDTQITNFIKGNNEKIINLAGRTETGDLFYLISKINLLISNDSIYVQIASAYNTPTIDIYGPTLPSFGFYPLSTKHKIIEIENLDCRPCSKNGNISCHKGHFKCMMDIKPNIVLRAVYELLQIKGEKDEQ